MYTQNVSYCSTMSTIAALVRAGSVTNSTAERWTTGTNASRHGRSVSRSSGRIASVCEYVWNPASWINSNSTGRSQSSKTSSYRNGSPEANPCWAIAPSSAMKRDGPPS